ncbi:MAG: Rrf2 family transcriptional regulator [Rhodobacteraceae bacterium]|nr:MAG: Rrf2 family transcriptional regulator [Paracoccaceae bacterium]
MRVTKRTNIAIRVLMFCAANDTRLVTKAEIAKRCNASENHLAQVVNQMGQLGFLKTHRGRNGGLELGAPAKEIRIGEVFRALEGEVPASECFADTDNSCPLREVCRLRIALADACEAFFAHLDDVTLDSLVCDNVGLLDFLNPMACNHR